MTRQDRHNIIGWVQAVDRAETRAADGSQGVLRLSGYAALFNSPSERMGRIVETIDPRAFDQVLTTNPDVRFQAEHSGLALARTTNDTLRLGTDDRGLWFEADLNPNTQAGRDLYALVERGDITQMSFGFTIDDEQLDDAGDTVRARIMRIGRLFELSAVTFAAYPATTVDIDRGYSMGSDQNDDEENDDMMRGINDDWCINVARARRLREQAD